MIHDKLYPPPHLPVVHTGTPLVLNTYPLLGWLLVVLLAPHLGEGEEKREKREERGRGKRGGRRRRRGKRGEMERGKRGGDISLLACQFLSSS